METCSQSCDFQILAILFASVLVLIAITPKHSMVSCMTCIYIVSDVVTDPLQAHLTCQPVSNANLINQMRYQPAICASWQPEGCIPVLRTFADYVPIFLRFPAFLIPQAVRYIISTFVDIYRATW